MAHHHEQKVPRGVLIGAAVLMVTTIGIAATARSARLAEEAERASAPAPAPLAVVQLRFEDRDDGSVAVLDAAGGEEVAQVPPEEGGFVRGVLRGMFRTRKLEGIDPREPFRLAREADGRLLLSDPTSGREVELRSFGHTNYESFVALLDAGEGGG